MSKTRIYFLSLLSWILIISSIQHSVICRAEEPDKDKIKQLELKMGEWKELAEKRGQRLDRLEPSPPQKIKDPPFGYKPTFPSNIKAISEVIHVGRKIPYKVIVNKPNYERPAYEEHWHSTVGRWSYIPNRIHYALHRLFANYDIGLSNWYDFEHDVGISIPMFQDEKALDLYIVVFQTEVTNVYTKQNQVVVIGNPKRNGVQVITIKTGDVYPLNEKEPILIQLATDSGDEIDFTLIGYVASDFWAKQKVSPPTTEENHPQN